MIDGVRKINAPRVGFDGYNVPKNIEGEIHSWFDEEEILTTPLEDLYGLLETRCSLYNDEYKVGCKIIKDWREEIVNSQDKEKEREYNRKYYATKRKDSIKRYEIKLDKVKDADIISFLDSHPCRTDLLKELIRAEIKRH